MTGVRWCGVKSCFMIFTTTKYTVVLSQNEFPKRIPAGSAKESPAEKHPPADAAENTAQNAAKWIDHEFIDEGAPNWTN